MPTEIHWQILRDFLKHPETIELFPQDSYDNRSWGFGSLGILSVSKYFSTIGLIVLYGENDFSISKSDCSLKDFDDSMNPVDEREPVSSPIIISWSDIGELTYLFSIHTKTSNLSAGSI